MLNSDYEYCYEEQQLSPLSPLPPPSEDTLIVLCDTQHTTSHPHTVADSTRCGGRGVTCTEICSELNICSLHSAWSEQSACTKHLLAIEYSPEEGGDFTPTPDIELSLHCNVQDDDQRVNSVYKLPAGRSDAAGPPQWGGRISKPTQPPKLSTAQPQQVQDSIKNNPSTPHQPQLKNKKLRYQSENYICNLYGWSAWWERVTRVTCRPKKSLVAGSQKISLTEKIKKSEAEKSRFVRRYFGKETQNEQDFDWPREDLNNTRAAPKRQRYEEDTLSEGEIYNVRKKQKVIFDSQIGEGGVQATTEFFWTTFIKH